MGQVRYWAYLLQPQRNEQKLSKSICEGDNDTHTPFKLTVLPLLRHQAVLHARAGALGED